MSHLNEYRNNYLRIKNSVRIIMKRFYNKANPKKELIIAITEDPIKREYWQRLKCTFMGMRSRSKVVMTLDLDKQKLNCFALKTIHISPYSLQTVFLDF